MKIKVSTNARSNNKENPQYLHSGWINRWLTPAELADWIKQGKAWAGTHFTDGKRSEANAQGSNAIVFDFDGEVQLDAFWNSPTAQAWCALTYTSFSSTAEVNRFRAVFPLGGIPLTSPAEHKSIYKFIAGKLASELGITIQDDCGEKAERLWYGNDTTQVVVSDSAVVPTDVVAGVEIVEEPTYEYSGPSDVTDTDIKRCIWLLYNFIPPSEDGDYNTVYIPVTAACAALGQPMIEAWVDWVSRGHHGGKRSNMNPRLKWRGLGKRSGPSSLYAMAKRLDSQWRKLLPHDLWFGSANTQEIWEAFISGSIKCAPRGLFNSK